MNKRIKKKHNATRQSICNIRVNVSKTNHPITLYRDVKMLDAVMYHRCWYSAHQILDDINNTIVKPDIHLKPRYKYIKEQMFPKVKWYPHTRKIG